MIQNIFNEVNSVDLSYLAHHLTDDEARGFFLLDAGVEHYKLLGFLANATEGAICDIGTYKGASALALSHGGNQVYTFDVSDMVALNPKPGNINIIRYHKDTLFSGWLKSSLIMLDTIHDGIHERKVIEYLIENNWKGVLVLDDIHAFPEQNKLWNDITLRKEDVSHIGHHSGTGIIYFE